MMPYRHCTVLIEPAWLIVNPMDEGDRLGQLVEDLVAASDRNERLAISEKDAGHIATALHQEMEDGTWAREQRARKASSTIACQRGCNACCTGLIVVFEPEALAVAQWLRHPDNEWARSNFLQDFPQWNTGGKSEVL